MEWSLHHITGLVRRVQHVLFGEDWGQEMVRVSWRPTGESGSQLSIEQEAFPVAGAPAYPFWEYGRGSSYFPEIISDDPATKGNGSGQVITWDRSLALGEHLRDMHSPVKFEMVGACLLCYHGLLQKRKGNKLLRKQGNFDLFNQVSESMSHCFCF